MTAEHWLCLYGIVGSVGWHALVKGLPSLKAFDLVMLPVVMLLWPAIAVYAVYIYYRDF